MNISRVSAVLEIAIVALITVIVGLAVSAASDADRSWLALLAAISTGTGFLVAALTAYFSRRDALATRERWARDDRISFDTLGRERQIFRARSRAEDNLSFLANLADDADHRTAVEPPGLAIAALGAVKAAAEDLAALGDSEGAQAIDRRARAILELHGKLSWLWFFAKLEDDDYLKRTASRESRGDDAGAAQHSESGE